MQRHSDVLFRKGSLHKRPSPDLAAASALETQRFTMNTPQSQVGFISTTIQLALIIFLIAPSTRCDTSWIHFAAPRLGFFNRSGRR